VVHVEHDDLPVPFVDAVANAVFPPPGTPETVEGCIEANTYDVRSVAERTTDELPGGERRG